MELELEVITNLSYGPVLRVTVRNEDGTGASSEITLRDLKDALDNLPETF